MAYDDKYDSKTGNLLPCNTRDRRLSVGLSMALDVKQSDSQFKKVWLYLFSIGVTDEATPPSEYEYSCPF